MFFRNQKPQQFSFEDRLASLKQAGFTTHSEAGGHSRVTRNGCGTVVADLGGGKVGIGKPGVLLGNEIAALVNHGYQMFLCTPSGKEAPALATHLKALHAFEEDLREALGLVSLYNVALGTTSDDHLYDRVAQRDNGPHHQPWEK
jgi:hypothetical protein